MDVNRWEEFLMYQEGFKTNASNIIDKMVDWCSKTVGSKHLVDEILHSIFFLGKINQVPFSPGEIIPGESIDGLMEKYPQPFECYETQLPKRCPFSCVLDMNVLHEGPENEDKIKEILKELVNNLKPDFLVSTTICVSKSNKSANQYGVSMSTTKCVSKFNKLANQYGVSMCTTKCVSKFNKLANQYGVSMCTTGGDAGRIIIAASCLSGFWDEYVAGAVMTYYPEKEKKVYFDGTIKVPTDVYCKAYNIKSGDEKKPCKSCGNLFDLHPNDVKEWSYGNCAEAESLSKLFKIDPEVKNRAKPGSDTCTLENRERARVSVLEQLSGTLRTIKFNTWKPGDYYTPQTQ